MTDTPDALNTANNLAAIEVLLGHPAKAAPIFAEAVRLREKLFGASAGTAALLSNYGKVLLQLGDAEKALPLLTRAAPMANRFAGAGSILHVSALAGLSEAHIALENRGEAMDVARKVVAAGGTEPAPPRAIAHIALGRALAASGDEVGARAALGIATPIVTAMGSPAARLQQGIDDIKARYRL